MYGPSIAYYQAIVKLQAARYYVDEKYLTLTICAEGYKTHSISRRF